MSNSKRKLNLGSGDKRIEGFLNVDYSEECSPDFVVNLEETPWPFETGSVSHIVMNHSLEHIGQTPGSFINIMKELYRICSDKALIEIAVPHPSHENFDSDPTHVRAITPMTLALFDRAQNLEWRKAGAANSPLALQTGVNFRIIQTENRMDQPVRQKMLELHKRDPLLADILINHGRNIFSEIPGFKFEVQLPVTC
jgi:hypothetical protein